MKEHNMTNSVTVLDNNQTPVLLIEESSSLIKRGINIDFQNNNRLVQLISDSIKGVMSIPNRTFKVMFKDKIEQGLKNGTYELLKTKDGELLVDAIDKTSKKIVGKARVVEGGKARQLATAGFQILSIAVAQAHLADINKTLRKIEEIALEIKGKLDNEQLTRVTGNIRYLMSQIIPEIENGCDLSVEKIQVIEDIIKEIYQIQEMLNRDFRIIINKIETQKDEDIIGYGNTFESINKTLANMPDILERRKLIIHLCLIINFIKKTLKNKSEIVLKDILNDKEWLSLEKQFLSSANNKIKEIFGDGFNKKQLTRSLSTSNINPMLIGMVFGSPFRKAINIGVGGYLAYSAVEEKFNQIRFGELNNINHKIEIYKKEFANNHLQLNENILFLKSLDNKENELYISFDVTGKAQKISLNN